MFRAKHEGLGMTWPQITEAVTKEFDAFPTPNAMKDREAKTDGVAPANWAPALALDWAGSETADEISPEGVDLLKAKMLYCPPAPEAIVSMDQGPTIR